MPPIEVQGPTSDLRTDKQILFDSAHARCRKEFGGIMGRIEECDVVLAEELLEGLEETDVRFETYVKFHAATKCVRENIATHPDCMAGFSQDILTRAAASAAAAPTPAG